MGHGALRESQNVLDFSTFRLSVLFESRTLRECTIFLYSSSFLTHCSHGLTNSKTRAGRCERVLFSRFEWTFELTYALMICDN